MAGFTQPDEARHAQCGCCLAPLRAADLAGDCVYCWRSTVCEGCAHECARCGDMLCRKHVIYTAREGFFARHLCSRCYEQEQEKPREEAA